jgi:hypothetical protein
MVSAVWYLQYGMVWYLKFYVICSFMVSASASTENYLSIIIQCSRNRPVCILITEPWSWMCYCETSDKRAGAALQLDPTV